MSFRLMSILRRRSPFDPEDAFYLSDETPTIGQGFSHGDEEENRYTDLVGFFDEGLGSEYAGHDTDCD